MSPLSLIRRKRTKFYSYRVESTFQTPSYRMSCERKRHLELTIRGTFEATYVCKVTTDNRAGPKAVRFEVGRLIPVAKGLCAKIN